jgi:RimJ/RimL family protein N-acetyltransferase
MRSLVLKTFESPVEILTERTRLRQWRESDLPAWVEMNADPEVRRYFESTQSAEEAYASALRFRGAIAERGWGGWAIEIPGVTPFAGFVGLIVQTVPTHFTPAVEIGWRLAQSCWKRGYATEAARAVVKFAFSRLELDELVSITVPGNAPSRAVMARLGFMRNAADDFDHPQVPDGHPYKRHVLYRLSRERFATSQLERAA